MKKTTYGGWADSPESLWPAPLDGCSFIEDKSPELNGIGINDNRAAGGKNARHAEEPF